MEDILKLHEEVFIFLDEWSELNRKSSSLINTYFYLRSVADVRFKKGYWFPGDESHLCISFWSGGDANNKTPNVYFDIHKDFGCRLIFTAKDSDVKFLYFNGLTEYLLKNKFLPNINIKTKELDNFISISFSNHYVNWRSNLTAFLNSGKKQIDEYILQYKPEQFEEFVSIFGFISSTEFDIMYSNVLKQRNYLMESNKANEFLSKPKLPFALLGISIENYQGIISTSVNNLRPDAKWIFIMGENGYGKTSLLQAIALGLSSDPDLHKYYDNKTRISIELIHNNEKAFPTKTKGNISISENLDFGQYVLGYGPARLNIQSKTSENMEDRISNNVLSLFDNETLLKNINYELFASSHSDKTTFDELEELIITVTKGRISQIKLKEREAQFVETLSNGDVLEPMPLSKLAAGFRSIINIVIDIYLRFKKIHSNKRFIDFYGIVLIDEIENHLHPILQRELPITLSQVFPNIQFIISTHSPILLLGADKNSIILKANRLKIEGVTIERLDESIDFANLLPNTILTSPIFGFQGIFSESRDDGAFVRVETTYAELQTNDDQSRRIARHLNKETASEILKLLKK